MKKSADSPQDNTSSPQIITEDDQSEVSVEHLDPDTNIWQTGPAIDSMPYFVHILYYSVIIIFNVSYDLLFDYHNTINELQGSPHQNNEATPEYINNSPLSSPSTPEENTRGNFTGDSPPQSPTPVRLDFGGEDVSNCYLS